MRYAYIFCMSYAFEIVQHCTVYRTPSTTEYYLQCIKYQIFLQMNAALDLPTYLYILQKTTA